MNGDRGLLYAEACFETFRVIRGAIFAWPVHAARLRNGLRAFGLDLPGGLKRRCLNQAAATGGDDALVRLTVTGGAAERALLPTCPRRPRAYIHAQSYTPHTDDLHLRAVTWPVPLRPRPAKFTSDYADAIRVLRHLKAEGLLADGEEALICDADRICSAPTANILLFQSGEWITPATDAALPGVVRNALIGSGCIRLAPCLLELADTCDAAALTNSGWFVRPVASINGRSLATAGMAFEQLFSILRGRTGAPKMPA